MESTYTLYGSTTSPFVRRIRLVLGTIPYTFKTVNLHDPANRSDFEKITPICKIPLLLHDNVKIFDSRIIYEYLNSLHWKHRISFNEQNKITLVNELNDTFVSIFYLVRNQLVPLQPNAYILNLKRRIDEIFRFIEDTFELENLDSFAHISLFCLIDWTIFRAQYQYDKLPKIAKFYDTWRNSPVTASTRPIEQV
ncbi:MAG: glutathione S-transferase family protein [Oligoflexales bacterium]|nr:glutathione S-transferase family protein [Oligoflexales bacterium]